MLIPEILVKGVVALVHKGGRLLETPLNIMQNSTINHDLNAQTWLNLYDSVKNNHSKHH